MAHMHVPYTPILFEGFRPVQCSSVQSRQKAETDLKQETEIGDYGTHHVC